MGKQEEGSEDIEKVDNGGDRREAGKVDEERVESQLPKV